LTHVKIDSKRLGMVYALMAYGTWGVLPLYWKLLRDLPHVEVLAHRVLWPCLFLSGLGWLTHSSDFWIHVKSSKKYVNLLVLSASLITLNWFVYIYAVNTGRVLESSLGYFISPIFSVFLGAVVFKERFKSLQKLAFVFAAFALGLLSFQMGQVPVLSLVIAFSFAFYSLVRKKISLDPFLASLVESWIQFALAVSVLRAQHSSSLLLDFFHHTGLQMGLLVLSGVVTALPLLWFAQAVQRLPLSTMGFLQYVSPTLQFALAVGFFSESFTPVHAAAFICIWIALGLYSVELLRPQQVWLKQA